MKKAVLAVSFGTSVEQARQNQIIPVENAMKKSISHPLFSAYTSPTIRRILRERGTEISDVHEALRKIASLGIQKVAVQPTYLLYGYEYDKLKNEVQEEQKNFSAIEVGVPLISNYQDLEMIRELVNKYYPPKKQKEIILIGHGTEHFANMVYPALQTAFRFSGREDIWVGTIEGWPGISEISKQVGKKGANKIELVPLMLVAGEHVHNDLIGDNPDSWKSILSHAGFSVDCTFKGLGEYPEIPQLYCKHLQTLLEKLGE